MDKVTINWNENCVLYEMISNSDHKYLDEHGFYAILTGIYDKVENTYKSIKLHYIGKAYEQTIREKADRFICKTSLHSSILQVDRNREASSSCRFRKDRRRPLFGRRLGR